MPLSRSAVPRAALSATPERRSRWRDRLSPRRPGHARRAVARLAIVLPVLLLAGCSQAVPGLFPPSAATTQGSSIRDLYGIVFVIGAAIFVLVEGLIIWTVIRYRRRPTDHALPAQVHGNNRLEIVWTAIPLVIVAFMFFVSWQTLNTVDAQVQAPAVRIQVVGFQWQWEFKYQDGPTLIGLPDAPPQLVVPVGLPVELSLKSQDVIHAFYVPDFLFKRDVVPGKENVFDFTVAAPGVYDGHCAEFCGLQHDRMLFSVRAVSPEAFQAWLVQARQSPSPSPSASPAQVNPPSGIPAPGGSPSAALHLTASNVAFDTAALTAAAGSAFAINFTNNDAGIPHNVAIHQGSAAGTEIWKGALLTGPGSTTYQVPGLSAGIYAFVCSVHPNMTGTLTVR